MSSNKYLEKVAGKLDSVIKFTSDVAGRRAKVLSYEADVLSRAAASGRTANHALADAAAAHKDMVAARTKLGIGAVVAGAGGFLGLHKYHQHKDAAILAKIDSMYADQNRNRQ